MGWGTSFGSDPLHALNLCLSYCYVTPRVTPFAQTHPACGLPKCRYFRVRQQHPDVMLMPRGEPPMDQTLTPAQQRARLHQLLDTLPDAAVAAWLQLLDASGTPTTAPAPRGEAPLTLDDALALQQQGNAAFTTDMVPPDATPPLPPPRPHMTPEQALAVQVGDHVQYRDRIYTVLAIREAGLINVRGFELDGLPGARRWVRYTECAAVAPF